jgi:hypothetical protein
VVPLVWLGETVTSSPHLHILNPHSLWANLRHDPLGTPLAAVAHACLGWLLVRPDICSF